MELSVFLEDAWDDPNGFVKTSVGCISFAHCTPMYRCTMRKAETLCMSKTIGISIITICHDEFALDRLSL